VFGSEVDVFVVLLLVDVGCCIWIHKVSVCGFRLTVCLLLGSRSYALFNALAPLEVVFHALAEDKATHNGIYLFQELAEVCVRLDSAHSKFCNEAIHLVNHEQRLQLFYP